MHRSRRWLPLWLAVWGLAIQAQCARAELVEATLDPPPLMQGDPLSARALVQKPPVIRELGSWTIETKRHRGYVSTAALSPDDKWIATGGLDGIVRLWDTSSGEFVRALVGHGYYVYGLAWSPDGRYLATGGSYDYTVRIWDTSTWQPVRLLKGFPGFTYRLAWSPNGRTLTITGGSPSGYIWNWDIDRQAAGQELGTNTFTNEVAWSPDPDNLKLAAASSGGSILIYNTREKKYETLYEMPSMTAYTVAWSPDGKLLAGGGAGPTRIWDTVSHEKQHELGTAAATSVAWSPDGKTLATGTGSNTSFWAIPVTGTEPTHTAGYSPRSILWAKDSQLVYLVDTSRIVKWSLAEKKALATFDIGGDNYVHWVPGRPIIASLHSSSLELWDPVSCQSIAKLVHEGAATVAVWSRDGKQLATGCNDHKVRLWDTAGVLVKTLEGHTGPVTCAAWSNATTLATGSSDQTIRIWDLATKKVKPAKAGAVAEKGPEGEKVRVLKKHTTTVGTLAWSREGKMLASSGGDQGLLLWAGDKDEPSLELQSKAVQSLAFAPAGKFLAVGHVDGDLDIHSFPGGKLVHTYKLDGSPPNVNSLAWSSDASLLLSGRGDHRFQIWKGSDLTPVHNITSMSPVLLTAWCTDNKTIAISGHDRTVRVYNAPTGTLEGVAIVGASQVMLVTTTGHYSCPKEDESELVYVVQTITGQETLSPQEFATRYKWKNQATQTKLPSR